MNFEVCRFPLHLYQGLENAMGTALKNTFAINLCRNGYLTFCFNFDSNEK